MKVSYINLEKQFNDEKLFAKIKKNFSDCQFIMGSEVEEFEKNFAKLCNVEFAVGLNSGTDAIFLALKALDIGSGDEVITVPNSFIATAGAIVAAGAKPVFVDVWADYNIDVSLIEKAITSKTKAILPVHLTGNPADMPAIIEIAAKKGLYVIEDAAQAAAASIDGKPVGTFGDIGCFSLHPLKNLNVCGDAGVLTTKSKTIYEKIKKLRNHGLKNRDEIEFFGYNSRMDTILAGVANYVMEKLEDTTDARIENAEIYDSKLKELSEFILLPPRKTKVKQVFHTYIIRAKKRTELIEHLNSCGVETKIHYPIPIHLQKPCLQMGYKKGDFPVCEAQAKEILSLPVHQYLTFDLINYVLDLIKTFYKK